jgi:hypothetical protein
MRTSLQFLQFSCLSKHTGSDVYWDAALQELLCCPTSSASRAGMAGAEEAARLVATTHTATCRLCQL